MTDGETVGFGYFEEMICRKQSSRPRHIVNDDARFSWNIFAEMARNETSVSIVSTARRRANDNSNSFPFIERRSAECELRTRTQDNQQNG
jgi:hypothetical protein